MSRKRKLILVLAVFTAAVFPAAGGEAESGEKLLFGVHPYRPATELEFMFAPLTAYLSSLVDRPVELRVSKDYEEHIRMIGENVMDVAFMGPASYVQLVADHGKKPLLGRFEISRVPTYYGMIIVAEKSPLRLLNDLKGRRFAFGDRRSTMAHLVPRFMIADIGISVEDFAEYTFMGNQDNVALGVLVGEYDAGAVKEEVFVKYESRGLRILAVTPPVSEHLFVASSTLPPDVVSDIKAGLLKLKESREGQTILRSLKPTLTALVEVEDSDYDNLRAMLQRLNHLENLP